MHGFITSTSLTGVAKLSLPIHTLGSVDVRWNLAAQEAAAEDSTFCTDEMVSLIAMVWCMTVTCIFDICPFLFSSPEAGMKTLIDILLCVWLAAVVSAPRLTSMILYLPITNTDLKLFLVNDLRDGRSGFRIHLYDHLSVSPAMAVDTERQGSRLTLSIWRSPNLIILPARHKHELLHLLFNNMAKRVTNPTIKVH